MRKARHSHAPRQGEITKPPLSFAARMRGVAISRILQAPLLAVLLALQGHAQLPEEVQLIARMKDRVREQLVQLRNFTCLQTTERWTRPNPATMFRLVDVLRFETAMIGSGEVFSRPGSGSFNRRHPSQLLAAEYSGMLGNGEFLGHAREIFESRAATVVLHERSTSDITFRYDVPLLSSGFVVRNERGTATAAYRGAIRVSADALQLLEIQIETDAIPPMLGLSAVRVNVRYVPVRSGQKWLILPSTAETSLYRWSGAQERNRITFSHCREYRSESSIVFSPDESSSEPYRTETGTIRLPVVAEGLVLQTSLRTRLDSRTVVAGDSVESIVEKGVISGGRQVVPSGALLSGRVRLVRKIHGPRPCVVFILEFSALELAGTAVPVYTELRDVESTQRVHRTLPAVRRRVSTSHLLHAAESQPSEPEGFGDETLFSIAVVILEGHEAVILPGLKALWLTRSLTERWKERRSSPREFKQPMWEPLR